MSLILYMTSTKSKENILSSIKPSLIQVVFLVLAVGASFYIGKLSTEVKFYKEGINSDQLGGIPNQPTNPAADPLANTDVAFPSDSDHIRGNRNAKFAIIEYSDFDCPFCGSFHETAQQFVDESEGNIMWVYRHFPLEQMHPEAVAKAVASECAALQGGSEVFWAFSDELFTGLYKVADLPKIVSDLGLNSSEFESCLENEDTIEKVRNDQLSGDSAGVRGTPGNFLINLETEAVVPLMGAVPIENMNRALDSIK